MPTLSRRRFLKISTGAVGVAAAAGALPATGLPQWLGRAAGGDEIREVPTYCDICFWKCGAIATVRNGRLWKIEGNPRDPLSAGRLCPRGTAGIGAHFDTQRLTSPLLRRRRRGEEEWAQVT
jgi:thiosulfate reductase / polysulfide reductase chain A